MAGRILVTTLLMGTFISGIVCPTAQQKTSPIVNAECECIFENDYWDITCTNLNLVNIPEWTTPRYYQRIRNYRLTYNRIEQARGDHFDGTNVERLELGNNDLTQTSFLSAVAPHLKHLYLDYNKNLGSHLEMYWPSFIYRLEMIDVLKLDSIGASHFDYFSNASNLATLKWFYGRGNDLTDNSLKSTTFSKMTSLTILDLSRNFIPDLEWLNTSAFSNLELLELTDNLIQEFQPRHVQYLTNIKRIILEDNVISVLNQTTFDAISSLNSIESINLVNNPINCTCDDAWFAQWLNDNGRIEVILDTELKNCISELPALCGNSTVSTPILISTPEPILENRNISTKRPRSGNTTTEKPQTGLSETAIITIAGIAATVVLGIIIAVVVIVLIRNKHPSRVPTNFKLPPPPTGSRATIDSQYQGTNSFSGTYMDPDSTGYYTYIKDKYPTAPDGTEASTNNRQRNEGRTNMQLPPTPNDGYLIPTTSNNNNDDSDGYIVPLSSDSNGYIEPISGNHPVDDTYQELTPHNELGDDYTKPNQN